MEDTDNMLKQIDHPNPMTHHEAQPAQVDLAIENTTLLQPDYSFARNKTVLIQNGVIVGIADSDKHPPYTAKEIINGERKLTMPGLVDGHTHLSQQFLRGMISDEFPVIYKRFNLPLESKLTPDQVLLSTQLSCLEMIKSGTTAFADAGGTHLDQLVQGVQQSGLRAALTRSTSDTGDIPKSMKNSTKEGLRLSEQFFNQYHHSAEGRITVWFQYRTIASCTTDLIVGLTDLAKQHHTGVHTHMSEYGEAVLYTLRTYGVREIEYLHRLGVLFSGLLAAHSALISEQDIQRLAEHDVKVVHCPRSNLGKAVTKTPSLLNHGVSVGFGTDGTAHSGLSLWRELTAFRHSQIITHGVPYLDFSVMNSRMLIDMLIMGGARAFQLDNHIGSIEIGKQADLITIQLDRPHITPTHNLLNTLTESVDASDVSDTVINGNILMKDRQVLSLDEEKLMYQARSTMKSINAINKWPKNTLFTGEA